MTAGILAGVPGLYGEPGYALITGSTTSVGGLVPDVLVSEIPRDELVITDHPVDGGAAITDHTFIRPTVVEMRIGFSNSSAGFEGYVEAIYQEFLTLQKRRELFDVFTSRRQYRNMLIASITAPRDEKTNSVLDMVIALRQVTFTRTQQSNAARASPDANAQASPQTTGSVSDAGSQQLQPVTPGSDGFGATFSPGSNTDFLGAPAGSGLAASGADASVGDFAFGDGTTFQGGAATGAQTGAPSDLKGNLGTFGSYAPGAFGK